jgi:hypothetical protein
MNASPDVVTTCVGIGGARRNISVPTQPSMANEKTKIEISRIQSRFIGNLQKNVVNF